MRRAVDKWDGQVDDTTIHTDRGLSRGLLIVFIISMYQSMLVRLNRSALASFSAIFALALAGGGSAHRSEHGASGAHDIGNSSSDGSKRQPDEHLYI